MNIKITTLLFFLMASKLFGTTIEGSLFKIDSDLLCVQKVLIAPNEVKPQKEPPLIINSITYLCTLGNSHAIFREGNVARSDPALFETEIIDTIEVTSELYRFVNIVCIEKTVVVVGILIQQMEYSNSIKNSNSIYISLRGKNKESLEKALDLLSKNFQISFDSSDAKKSLHKSGFRKSSDAIKKMLEEAEKTLKKEP